jgi:hypothetical protein
LGGKTLKHEVEKIDKKQLEPSLKAATRHTRKGEYHKIQQASKF